MVIVRTTKGEIGGIQGSNCQHFLGIPFAKPPIGDLRFQEPQPMDPWHAIKDATKFGPIPPQIYRDNPPINQKEDEDCLYCNIWTPAADNKARPVMFWIYGGGFMIGAGSRNRLNGARLAAHGDVVVVNFNYRLGALGFLNLPGITPNIGILDQIAALKWVKENIEGFGGDPNNITIFGESAGGSSVAILLTSPASRGLFQKAIMESGAANPTQYSPERAKKGSEKLLSKLRINIDNIHELREIPLKKLMRAQRIAGGLIQIADVPFQPFLDGKTIPEHPLEIMRKGKASNVPIIIGSNEDELGFFSRLLQQADKHVANGAKPIIEAILSKFQSSGIKKKKLDGVINIYKKETKKKHPDNPFKYLDALLSDSMFRIPIIRNLEACIRHQQNAYCYIFTYGSRTDGVAFHTIEIPFVFGNLDTTDTLKGTIGTGEEEVKLAKNVMDAWVAFARTGNPNHDGLPEWPVYGLEKRATMMLGINSKVINDPLGVLRKAWDGIL